MRTSIKISKQVGVQINQDPHGINLAILENILRFFNDMLNVALGKEEVITPDYATDTVLEHCLAPYAPNSVLGKGILSRLKGWERMSASVYLKEPGHICVLICFFMKNQKKDCFRILAGFTNSQNGVRVAGAKITY